MAKKRYDFDKLIAGIPGYDPRKGAEAFIFDERAATLALDFFMDEKDGCLTFWEGAKAGQKFHLEPWQQAIVANLFGWKQRDNGLRRYREVFIFVPRKNGKSPLAAGLALYMLAADGEPGAQVYLAAADTEQATIVFRHMSRMIEQDPALRQRAKVYKGYKSIEWGGGEGYAKVLSGEAHTKHGGNSHCVIVDELHALPDRELVDVLQTSFASREQPVMVCITTSDFDRESICNEKHDYATKVRNSPTADLQFLPVIYEASPDDDWTKRSTWVKANPNLGVSVSEDYIARECGRAKIEPSFENTFKRLHLNMKTEQANRWLPMDAWDECAGDDADDPVVWRRAMLERLRGMACVAGLDLGSTADLTAMVLLFEVDGKSLLMPWFWVPTDGVHRKDTVHRQLYETWIRQGFMQTTDGNVADYDAIRNDITGVDTHGSHSKNAIADDYGVANIAVDQLFQGAQLCTQLNADGMTVTAFGQGFVSMAAPAKEFEERVMSGKIVHGNNPVLRWMASNVSVLTDPAGNIKPVKPKHNSNLKIDGIVAAVMAVGRAIAEPHSVYETRGVLTV